MSDTSGLEKASPEKPWKITIALAAFMMINSVDKVVLGLVAVPMMDELKLSPQEFGFIAASFYWLFAVGGVAGGFLLNRFSAKAMALCMIVLWSICQLPTLFPISIFAFIVCRLLLGASEGGAWPVAVHAVCKWFPDHKRNLPVAILGQGSGLGLIAAGFLIPAITAQWGWRANFLVLAIVGFTWAAFWAYWGDEGKLDQAVSANTQVATAPPVSYARLLTDRCFLGCIITHFVGFWSLALALTWLPAYFERGLGYDGYQSGWLYAFVIGMTVPIGIGLAWWSQVLLRNGVSSKVARGRYLSCFLMLAGVLLAAVHIGMAPDWIKIGLLALAIGFTPVVYSLGPAVLAEVVPSSQRGAMLAINNSLASLAGIAAPLATGALIQGIPGIDGYEIGFALCGGLMIIGGLLGFWLIDPARSVQSLRRFAADRLAGQISSDVSGRVTGILS